MKYLPMILFVLGCIGEPIKKTDLYGADSMTRQRPADCDGATIDFGVDDNQDGTLSDSEVDHTVTVCNGKDGAAGDVGPQGATGASGAPGDAGIDGMDGAAGPAGAPGRDGATGPAGADGAAGRDGAAATFREESVKPGVDCPKGGTRLHYGTTEREMGAILVCAQSCGAYQCGGDCGTCSSGHTCQEAMCVDIDECLAPAACHQRATCANTVGAFTCTCNAGFVGDGQSCEPACSGLLCDTGCVNPSDDVDNCGACGIQCGVHQACVSGVCVGSGQLRFSSTWSRPGDIDVWVTTPNGVSIGWQNQRADGGQQDRDDTRGSGPENIFWEANPPLGAYHVCVATNYIQPNAASPVTVRVVVARPAAEDEVFEREYTDSRSFGRSDRCSPEHPTYLGSVSVE
jgi:hypothetical protein